LYLKLLVNCFFYFTACLCLCCIEEGFICTTKNVSVSLFCIAPTYTSSSFSTKFKVCNWENADYK